MNPKNHQRRRTAPTAVRKTVTARLSPAQAAALDQIARELNLATPSLPITSGPNMGRILVACAFGLLAHERDADPHGELRRMLKRHATNGEAGCCPCWFANHSERSDAPTQLPWLLEELQQPWLEATIPLAV